VRNQLGQRSRDPFVIDGGDGSSIGAVHAFQFTAAGS
jgi:hypothetical protein